MTFIRTVYCNFDFLCFTRKWYFLVKSYFITFAPMFSRKYTWLPVAEVKLKISVTKLGKIYCILSLGMVPFNWCTCSNIRINCNTFRKVKHHWNWQVFLDLFERWSVVLGVWRMSVHHANFPTTLAIVISLNNHNKTTLCYIYLHQHQLNWL